MRVRFRFLDYKGQVRGYRLFVPAPRQLVTNEECLTKATHSSSESPQDQGKKYPTFSQYQELIVVYPQNAVTRTKNNIAHAGTSYDICTAVVETQNTSRRRAAVEYVRTCTDNANMRTLAPVLRTPPQHKQPNPNSCCSISSSSPKLGCNPQGQAANGLLYE